MSDIAGLLYSPDVVLSGAMPFSAPARHAWLLTALLLATVAGRAAAVELTPAPDGAIDLRDGAVTVVHLQPQTPALRRGTAAIREQTVDGHRVAVVRIPVRGSARVEEWLIDLGAKPAKVLWSGMTGPRASDDEGAAARGPAPPPARPRAPPPAPPGHPARPPTPRPPRPGRRPPPPPP